MSTPDADQYGRPPAPDPEPLPATAFDSHCHLNLLPGPVPDVLARAASAGIRRVVTVGTDLPSSYWAVACAADHAAVYAAVAIHPNDTVAVSGSVAEKEAVLEEIAALAREPRVRAVGETGLDYYWDDAPHDLQQEWFRAHIAIARQSGKALMIHDRDAHEDVLRILEEEGPPDRVVFHCFSGDAAMAKRCAAAGYVLSFAGTLTFKNAQPLRDAAAAVPADAVLVETDAPFLTPMPNRGRSNAPVQVVHTLRALAAIKQLDVAELCAIIEATGERVFGPW
ncbi:MAG: TatD family hydrolase [Streptosporangiaceae bacterium]